MLHLIKNYTLISILANSHLLNPSIFRNAKFYKKYHSNQASSWGCRIHNTAPTLYLVVMLKSINAHRMDNVSLIESGIVMAFP